MPSFLSGCLLFISCLTACAGQETRDPELLALGHPAAVLLTPEHGATLLLDSSGSEAEEIVLDAAVPDISYRIVAANGVEIASASVGTFGWTAIPFRIPACIEGSCEISIQLKIESGAEGLPGVRVRVELRPIPLRAFEENRRAARAFNAAQMLHRSLRAEDIRQAILQFDRAAGEWGGSGDSLDEALALGGIGESEIELSRYGDAKQTLNRALGIAGNNDYLRGWLLHLLARVYLDQWEPKPAKGFAEQALRLGQGINDAGLIALARTDLAGVAYWDEDIHANEIADQAHDEAVLSGIPETLALERRWKGWLEENDEHNARATALMSQAEFHFRQAGDSRTALEATGQIAQAMNLNGDLYSALAKLLELEPLAKTTGNNVDYGILLENIGTQYVELGKSRFAEVYFHQAEMAYARAHFQHGLMLINGSLCETELSLNEIASAVADCKISFNIARQTQDPVFIGIAQCQLGLADRKAGRLTQAFADLTEAVRQSHIGSDFRRSSQEHIQLGELLDLRGSHREALAEFEQAKSLSQLVADPSSLLEARYAVARWYTQDGQFAKADEELAPALKQLEAARGMVSDNTLQASYFAAERKCYELAVELRMRQFERYPTEGADALALEMSERSRARGLLDALRARAAPGAHESGEAEARLMHANMALDRAFGRRLKLLVDGVAKRDLDASSEELTEALGNLERAEDEMHAAQSQATNPAKTMSTAEFERASLGAGATFLEYALGEERSYLWVVGGGKIKSYVLPPRDQLKRMVKQWRSLATGQDRSEADAAAKIKRLSARLSCALFADAVLPKTTRLVIVPDGELAMLPFGALPENGCSSVPGEPLVAAHEVTLTPSLSVFLSRKPGGKNIFKGEVAIVADPVFDAADPRVAALNTGMRKRDLHSAWGSETAVALPRLLNAGYEAKAIQEIVGKSAGRDHVFLAQGFDASVDTVLNPAMRGYRIWHLGTHGIYDESMPEFSGLVFSLLGRDRNPRFGFLKAHDIAQLNIPAELVVLSACDSAAGENVNGEGVMGLSYAFLHAGAKQVISTFWTVDDAKSRDLMIAFYKELMQNGGNAAAALRQSQLTLMRQRQSSAPYYWAGFELTSVGR